LPPSPVPSWTCCNFPNPGVCTQDFYIYLSMFTFVLSARCPPLPFGPHKGPTLIVFSLRFLYSLFILFGIPFHSPPRSQFTFFSLVFLRTCFFFSHFAIEEPQSFRLSRRPLFTLSSPSLFVRSPLSFGRWDLIPISLFPLRPASFHPCPVQL